LFVLSGFRGILIYFIGINKQAHALFFLFLCLLQDLVQYDLGLLGVYLDLVLVLFEYLLQGFNIFIQVFNLIILCCSGGGCGTGGEVFALELLLLESVLDLIAVHAQYLAKSLVLNVARWP
jgi:hypothetical protein